MVIFNMNTHERKCHTCRCVRFYSNLLETYLCKKYVSLVMDIEENHALQQQNEPLTSTESLFYMFCSRENLLLVCRGYSWIPRADSVTGARTRNWILSRNNATKLFLPLLTTFLGSHGHSHSHQCGQGSVVKT